MIWQTSGLTAEQRSIVEEAERRSRFDSNLLLPGLRKSQGTHRNGIPVEFTDLSKYAKAAKVAFMEGKHAHIEENGDHAHLLADKRARVLGLAWYSGKISIDSSLNRALALEVFLAEGAHMIDFFWMTDNDRAAIAQALHPDGNWQHDQHGWFEERGDQDYNDWPGENFMDLYMLAATDVKPSMAMRWSHPITQAAVNATRTVLERGFKAPPPAPEPVSPDSPGVRVPTVAWSYKGSSIYHTRIHKRSNPSDPGVAARYASEKDAANAGMRPCSWCRLKIGKLP